MDEIIQLKITLDWTKPPIWRRVLVEKHTTFFELHNIIQIVMGWDNSHLYEFNFKNTRIGEPNEDFDFDDDELLDSLEITLGEMIKKTKEKLNYTYDFGDSWEHTIVVEKFLPHNDTISYPTCIDGKLNCPPEDCGGVPGFYHLLEILEDKKHPEREEMMEWIGDDYDSQYFDKEEVNAVLKSYQEDIDELEEDEEE